MAISSVQKKNVISILGRGPLSNHMESIRLSKIAAHVLKPVFKDLGYENLASGENIRIKRRIIRLKDKDPYSIDPEENPFENFKEMTSVEILCPTNGHISKLKQAKPRILSKLQERGFCSVEVSFLLDRPKPPIDNLYRRNPVEPIAKSEEGSRLAESLSERLDPSSPLKKALLDLAEALKPK